MHKGRYTLPHTIQPQIKAITLVKDEAGFFTTQIRAYKGKDLYRRGNGWLQIGTLGIGAIPTGLCNAIIEQWGDGTHKFNIQVNGISIHHWS